MRKFCSKMMRLMLYPLATVAWLASAGAAADFSEVIRSWTSPTRQQVLHRLLRTDEYAVLNSSFQGVLASGDLRAVTTTDMYSVPGSLWDRLGVGPLTTLPYDVRNYVQKNKVSARVKDELELLLSVNVSRAEAINQLRTLLPSASASPVKVRLLLEQLGDPALWTTANITEMKQILFYLPIGMLTRIKNPTAIGELHEDLRRCMETFDRAISTSCPTNAEEARGEGYRPRAQYMASLNSWVMVQQYTRPSNWTMATFKLLNLNSIPPKLLTELNDDVFMSREDAILTTLQSNQFRRDAIGRYVAKKILDDAEVMKDASVSTIMQLLDRLEAAHLTNAVYITDLPDTALDNGNGQLRRSMEALSALAVDQGSVDGEVVEQFMRELSGRDSLTQAEVQRLGPTLLALTRGTTLNATLGTQDLSANDIVTLSNAVRNTAGIGSQGKLLQIRNKIFTVTGNSEYLRNQKNLPDDLLAALPLKYLNSLFTGHLDLLRRSVSYNPTLLTGLVSQLSRTSVKYLPPNPLEAVSVSVLQDLSSYDMEGLTRGMPASSRACLVASQATYGGYTVTLSSSPALAGCLQASDARKVPEYSVVSELAAIKDTFPSYGACQVLKEKLVNRTKAELKAANDEEALALLSPVDMELMPVCVVAAFGSNLLRGLTPRHKALLLERLVRSRQAVVSTDAVSRATLQVMLEEGLLAGGWSEHLTGAEVQKLGELLLYAPASVVASVSREGSCAAVQVANTLGSSVLMPCLGGPHRDALKGLILQCLGEDPSQWTNITGICCLLHVVPLELLREVPAGGLVLCRCPAVDALQHGSWAAARELDCRRRLAGDYEAELALKQAVTVEQAEAAFDLMDAQASSRRRRRAAHEVRVCDLASVSGTDDLSEDQLRSAKSEEVVSCLAALGGRYMGDSKAQILLDKVLQTLDPRVLMKLTNDNIRDMHFIMKGVEASKIPELPNFSYPGFTDAVAVLGNENMKFSSEQLDGYAQKVLKNWRYPAAMSALDLAAFNRLVCALNASLISEFNPSTLKSAMGRLSKSVEGCDKEKVLVPLASRAKSIYSIPLKRAQVQEMGVVVAGLSVWDVASLPPDAMAGLTPQAASTLSSEAVRAMSPEQLRSLQSGTAQAVLQAHGSVLSAEQRTALSSLVMDSGSANSGSVHAFLLLPAAILLLWARA